MYRTLLVPLDGSAFAEQALPLACMIAQQARSRLQLVHVYLSTTPTPVSLPGMPVIDQHLHSLRHTHAQVYLAQVRDHLMASLSGVDCDTRLLAPIEHDSSTRAVADTLAAHVGNTDIDLVVMTTHGRGGLARFWLGSVASSLIQQCPAPLLLVRPDADGVVMRRTLRRILVPLDGSRAAERMVYRAFALGRFLAAEYVLVRVVHPFMHSGTVSRGEPIEHASHHTDRYCVNAQADLDRVANWMRVAGAQVSAHMRVASHPARAILDAAATLNADLIAMATYASRGWRQSILGSVTDSVVRAAHLPVLVYAFESLHADESAAQPLHFW